MENLEKNREEKWVEQYLFSKDEMDEMIHWQPVAKEEPKELSPTMKKIMEHHERYIKFWRIKNGIDR